MACHILLIALLASASNVVLADRPARQGPRCLWRRLPQFTDGTACSLPVDDSARTEFLLGHTSLTHLPVCIDHHAHGASAPLRACAFTAASAGNGLPGLSIVTTPDAASDAIAAAAVAANASLVASPPLPYDVRDIPGKGQGAVATRRIRRGESILTERPLLLARLDFFGHHDHSHGDTDSYDDGPRHADLLDLLAAVLAQLPDPGQAVIHTLARRGDHSSGDGGAMLEDVLRTNGLGITAGGGVGHTGLYPQVSRLNHACRPNTFWRYSPRTLEVEFVALRDIDAGEELTHSYSQKQTAAETQHDLLTHWGFRCTCSICVSAAESDALDAKQRQLKEIEEALEGAPKGAGHSNNGLAAPLLGLADQMMAIVDGEDALRAPRGAYSYHLVVAAQALWAAGFAGPAQNYTRRALAAAIEYGGPDDEHVAVLRDVLRMMGGMNTTR